MPAPALLRRLPWSSLPQRNPEILLGKEWLVANGLGGYASGTLSGACTRRYHGLLVAALPAPLGRMMMLNELAEELRLPDGRSVQLDVDAPRAATRLGSRAPDARWRGAAPSDSPPTELAALGEFRLETGLPVWRYETLGVVLEKRILLPHEQNSVYVTYEVLNAPSRVRLRLRPAMHFRPHEASVTLDFAQPYSLRIVNDRMEVHSEIAPPLRLRATAAHANLVLDGGAFQENHYQLERSRGYESAGRLWSPGYFRLDLEPGQSATIIASTEDWEVVHAASPEEGRRAELERRARLIEQADPRAREGRAAELVLAADQFIIRPTTRVADAAIAKASGDDIRTVIAGYHWFTDWGRDTMISLEGLTLTTGRRNEAGYLLRTFGRYVRDGLIPNLFPEGQREGLYHTADATLWYFHALHRYVQVSNDRSTLERLLPTLAEIVDHHLRGTHFGIRVDPHDGLLTQGQSGYQLTWMDAKVGDWVVTPRRGKAVEINALWYNALRLLEGWRRAAGDEAGAQTLATHADRAQTSFNDRFWNAELGYLFDVVDGERCGEGGGSQAGSQAGSEAGSADSGIRNCNDPALRPNQLLAIALDHPVLAPERWRAVVDQVEKSLLTPVGLRSLAPGHPDYKATYHGDLRSRDAAYHQGTVWAWLIGPYIDAYLRVYPDRVERARELLAGFEPHLDDACVGSISEVFDAQEPYYPRGCVAQAWSVAEVLRCLVKTAPADARPGGGASHPEGASSNAR